MLRSFIRDDLPKRFNESSLLDEHWPRVAGFLDGQILPPYEVLIHPSSLCNLRCEWCIGDHVPISKPGLPILDASKTADERLPDTLADPVSMMKVMSGILDYEVQAFRVENISFSGLIGEPLVAKEAILPAIRAGVEAGRRVGVFTNGVLMDEEVRETFDTMGYVLVSVDAGSPETYARVKFGGRRSGEEHFRSAIENLRALASLRRRTRSRLDINASYILYPETCAELYEGAKIIKDAGVDCLRIKQDNAGKRPLSMEQRVRALETLDRIDADLVDDDFKLVRIHHLDDPGEMQRHFNRCTITELMAAIGSDGCLYPCNYHPRPGGTTYGSAVDTPFREIWEGERRKKMKSQLPSICPKVCDPFKNRANRLLNAVRRIAEGEGIAQLDRERAVAIEA
jgi:pyruvate-formate lyase-activating enzyme